MSEAKKGFSALAEAFTEPDSLSIDDRERLDELGWHESEEFNCMAMFT